MAVSTISMASSTVGCPPKFPVHFGDRIALTSASTSLEPSAGQGDKQGSQYPNIQNRDEEKLCNGWLADSSQWWDNPGGKFNPKGPDLKHKSTNEAIWVESYKKSAWVDGELEKLDAARTKYSKIQNRYLCNDTLADPTQLWDNRRNNIHRRGPDFKHTSLWIDSYKKHLVDGHLKGAATQLCESGAPTLTTSFERCGDIRTLCKAGQLKEALQVLIRAGTSADSKTYVCLLQECIKLKGLAEGKQVHAHIIQSEFKPNIFLHNTLVNMHVKCGSVVDARAVFDKMPERRLSTWNIMLAGYVKQGYCREAVETYEQMMREGVTPNQITFICVLKASANLAALEKGKKVHADIAKAGIVPDMILNTALVNMYAKCGSIKDAKGVFDKMAERDVIAWSAMIAAYTQHGCSMEALEAYEQMMGEGVKPNQVTFVGVCNACTSLAALEKGKKVHGDIMKAGILPNMILDTALVDMYANCGSIDDAKGVFDKMAKRDVVAWTAMIAGYTQHGCGTEALESYEQMLREGVKPNQVTFTCVCTACASLAALEKGREVHVDILTAKIIPDVVLDTALVEMYAKCGSIEDAKGVFNNMAERDVVSWNVMIAGYTQHGCGMEAFEAYEQMMQEGVKANKVTFSCVCNLCASLPALDKGKEVHADLIKTGIVTDVVLDNTLVDMYAKCGSIQDAEGVFYNMAERDVVSWNVMISGYAQHGCGREALQLFEGMQKEGFKPDEITFICVLSACSHVGLVDEGRQYFDSLSQDHGLTPTVKHFVCIVDLLGRAGRLDEAEDFINKMLVNPDTVIWRTLLSACRIHGNVQVAERVAKSILKSDRQDAATYVLLSIIYAAAGRWEDTAKVRNMMKVRGVKREPGHCCIEVNNRVHTFMVDDKLHPQANP